MKTIIATFAIAATATLAAAQAPKDMKTIESYFECSEKAEITLLSPAEVQDCMNLYLQVKLSFLEDVDVDRFYRMNAKERADTNIRAYAAYDDWRRTNADLVEHLEAAARVRIGAPGS